MRVGVLSGVVLVAVLFPQNGKAQVFARADDAPLANAASAPWQRNGDPLYYAGSFYFPSGPTVFFNPYTMVRTGAFEGVPLYSDTTIEPYSIVYVPIGGNVMRPYERRRDGALTGTVGSRTPSFPVDRDVDVSARTPVTGLQFPPQAGGEPDVIPESAMPTGTGGSIVPTRPLRALAPESVESKPPKPIHLESIPRPVGNTGIWLEYQGAKWHAAGSAVEYVPGRFIRVGEYHGFPVFRDREDKGDRIYVPAVEGGSLTRYERP